MRRALKVDPEYAKSVYVSPFHRFRQTEGMVGKKVCGLIIVVEAVQRWQDDPERLPRSLFFTYSAAAFIPARGNA